MAASRQIDDRMHGAADHPALSVVIPSYNRCDGMRALLAGLARQQAVGFEVLVVDDASTDGTVAILRREFPWVRWFTNETNRGPCVTRNRGIREARAAIIVGFDSDVTIDDRRLLAKTLETMARYPDHAGIAMRILKPDGLSDDAPRWWHPVPFEKGKDRCFETSYFSGTAYAMRREAMLRAGLFPEILYMHYEEVVLAWRILDDGGSILYEPRLQVIHHANPVSRRSEIQVYYRPRNQVLVAVSCLPVWEALVYLLPRVAFQFAKALRGRHLDAYRRALKDAIATGERLIKSRKPLKHESLRRIAGLRRCSHPLSPVEPRG